MGLVINNQTNRSQSVGDDAAIQNVIANLCLYRDVDDQAVENVVDDNGPREVKIQNGLYQDVVLLLQDVYQQEEHCAGPDAPLCSIIPSFVVHFWRHCLIQYWPLRLVVKIFRAVVILWIGDRVRTGQHERGQECQKENVGQEVEEKEGHLPIPHPLLTHQSQAQRVS